MCGSAAPGRAHQHTQSAASQGLAWIMVLNISVFLFPYAIMKTADVNKTSSCQCSVELTVFGYFSAVAFTAQYFALLMLCALAS